jgi:hypothetical protein
MERGYKRHPRVARPALRAPLRACESSAGRRRRGFSGRRASAIAAVISFGLLLLAAAPATYARPAREGAGGAALAAASRASEREQRAAIRRDRREANRARRETERGERKAAHKPRGKTRGDERTNVVVTSTCTEITWTFRSFPDAPNNNVTERVAVGPYAPFVASFQFDGASGTSTTAINAPPGTSKIETGGKWKLAGAEQGFDIHSRKVCAPAPSFSIEKLQKIAGASGEFTTSPLTGKVGQTVDYEIVVKNTGNVPVTLSDFSDPNCEAGTLAGGPGEAPLAPGPTPALGASSTYTCSRALGAPGSYTNVATDTATPAGDGQPITSTSNTVVVNVPLDPEFSIEKLQKIAGTSGGFTTSPLAGKLGQTVDYEIVVKNTGDVPLTIANFSDPNCDAGTIAGGPGEAPLAVGASSTYTCDHVLTTAGSYSNVASDTATPPPGDGSPITSSSNTVVVNVPPEPGFSIEKLQKIAGSINSFQGFALNGAVGQTVAYEIVVRNTGNVQLTFTNFSDPNCDAGTIAGGPGEAPLAIGASSTYTCDHVLSAADQSAGSYSNSASDTGTPPAGEGSAVMHTSNTVVVELAGAGAAAPQTSTTPISPSLDPPSPRSGVLPFSSASVPAVRAPQGCLSSSFRASVKAAGVASVTFYLDGHKLKTLTARSARAGQFTIVLNAAKLSVGTHRLTAKITMAHAASGKTVRASRSVTLLRCRPALLTPKFTG